MKTIRILAIAAILGIWTMAGGVEAKEPAKTPDMGRQEQFENGRDRQRRDHRWDRDRGRGRDKEYRHGRRHGRSDGCVIVNTPYGRFNYCW